MAQGASLFLRLEVWARRSWPFLAIIGLIAYFGINAGRSIYQSYQDQKQTQQLQDQLKQADDEVERLKALGTYYRSEAYKEKELRRTMLLIQPGEKVYALPESSVMKQAEEAVAQRNPDSKDSKSAVQQLPIWQQWVRYLMHQG